MNTTPMRHMVIAVALAILAIGSFGSAQDEGDTKAAPEKSPTYKQRMTAKVGKKVTLTGRLELTMQGKALAFDDGGSVILKYDKAPREEHKKWYDLLESLMDERITVTGTLSFSKARIPQNKTGQLRAQPKPEFFYIDITAAEIERVDEPEK